MNHFRLLTLSVPFLHPLLCIMTPFLLPRSDGLSVMEMGRKGCEGRPQHGIMNYGNRYIYTYDSDLLCQCVLFKIFFRRLRQDANGMETVALEIRDK